jgi:hypothetical protein
MSPTKQKKGDHHSDAASKKSGAGTGGASAFRPGGPAPKLIVVDDKKRGTYCHGLNEVLTCTCLS